MTLRDRLIAARVFIRVQLVAASFGIMILALAGGTAAFWPETAPIARYDFLLLAALAIQALLLLTGLETLDEAKVIFGFHLVGTVMELFKTAAGAWVYPEESLLRIGAVPLFTGFMYSAVGSYIARSWRGYDLRFTGYPPFWATAALAAAIYVNFFAHHYVWDWRTVLFAATAALYWRCWAEARIGPARLHFPLLALFLGVGALIWIAENAATGANIWLYPNQMAGWKPVSPAKIGSWFLLMIVSFVLVSAIYRPDRPAASARAAPAE